MPIGIAVGLAVLVMVVALIALIVRAAKRDVARQSQLIEECTRGTATILAVGASHEDRSTRQLLVRFRLRVAPDGGEPYEVSLRWYVMPASVPQFQPGAEVKVRIHPTEKLLVQPLVQGADFSWADYKVNRTAG